MNVSRKAPDRAPRRAILPALVFVASWLTACGGGDGGTGKGSVVYHPPGGVSEPMLFANGEARLNLDHTVVILLEPAGRHDGDTGLEEGVDEFCYHFETPTEIHLSLDEFEEAPELIALDEFRNEIARAAAETGEAIFTASGEHCIQVKHPRAGDASAEPILLFLQPILHSVETTSALGGGGAQANATDVATLKAAKSCVRCNLSGLVWSACPGISFKGVDLSHADFSNAALVCMNFVNNSAGTPTLLTGANFTDAILGQSLFSGAELTDANFEGASFGVTVFDDVTATSANFIGATFANSTFGASSGTGSSAAGADFSEAVIHFNTCFSTYDLRDADFSGAAFDSSSSVHGTWFAGANLFDATFDGTKFRYDQSLPNCGASSTCSSVTVPDFCTDCPCNADLGCLDLAGETSCVSNDGPVSLSETVVCQRPTVQAEPSGMLFQDMDLRNVSFNGADLTNSVFASTTLDSTNDFDGAVLAGVDFTQQDLGKAVDLSGAFLSETTDFTGAVLSNATSQSGVILSCDPVAQTGGCRFATGTTEFMGADMKYAQLNHAALSQANLEGTLLDDAELVGANLTFTTLNGASLVGATLGAAPGSGGAASLRGSFMINVDLTDADLRSVDFTGAHIYGATTQASFLRAKLDSANLTDAILAGAVFTNATMTAAVFNGAQLANASFDGATLTNAKFDDAYLQGADFSTAASVTGMSLSNAAVSTMLTSTKCSLIAPGTWTYTEQDGTPYTFAFDETQLQTDATVICPDNGPGPCTTGDSLCPITSGPFPPIPECTPSAQYCYENCLSPPCYLDVPGNFGLCPLVSNCG